MFKKSRETGVCTDFIKLTWIARSSRTLQKNDKSSPSNQKQFYNLDQPNKLTFGLFHWTPVNFELVLPDAENSEVSSGGNSGSMNSWPESWASFFNLANDCPLYGLGALNMPNTMTAA